MTETALLVIVGMAAVTYLTRVSGLWVGGRLRSHPRFDAAIAALPGAILVSLVAPSIVTAGVPGFVAAGATVLVAIRLRGNILAAMLVGVLVVWALRMM
jgi:uncharacterized membrane protein